MLAALGIGAYAWLSRTPLPAVLSQERCVARVGDLSVEVDLEQAHFAAIIAGLSVRRDLAPRAASIALATAYQESGIRNIALRRPRLPRAVPAAAVPGLGHREADPGPALLDRQVLRRPGQGQGLEDRRHQRGGPEGPAQRLSRGLPGPRGRCPGAGQRPERSDRRPPSAATSARRPRGTPTPWSSPWSKTFGKLTMDDSSPNQVDHHHQEHRSALGARPPRGRQRRVLGVASVRVGDQQWDNGGNDLPSWVPAPGHRGPQPRRDHQLCLIVLAPLERGLRSDPPPTSFASETKRVSHPLSRAGGGGQSGQLKRSAAEWICSSVAVRARRT